MNDENIILLREFKYDSIKIRNKIKISRFVPENLKNLIDLNVPDKNYILGVTYSTGESQICISGHPTDKENMEEGTSRELEEELCLTPREDCRLKHCYRDKINFFYFMNINETHAIEKPRIKSGNDLKIRSVVCIYGELKDILCYMAKLKYNIKNEDEIEAVWATSKENIIKYLKNNKMEYLYNN